MKVVDFCSFLLIPFHMDVSEDRINEVSPLPILMAEPEIRDKLLEIIRNNSYLQYLPLLLPSTDGDAAADKLIEKQYDSKQEKCMFIVCGTHSVCVFR